MMSLSLIYTDLSDSERLQKMKIIERRFSDENHRIDMLYREIEQIAMRISIYITEYLALGGSEDELMRRYRNRQRILDLEKKYLDH